MFQKQLRSKSVIQFNRWECQRFFHRIFPSGQFLILLTTPSASFYDIEISLFQDMTNLGTVFAINHPLAEEVRSVQQSSNEK